MILKKICTQFEYEIEKMIYYKYLNRRFLMTLCIKSCYTYIVATLHFKTFIVATQ